MPRITVITPSYNQGIYLGQTIRSVIDQDYTHFEFLVSDGGSTDNSTEVIRFFEQRISWWVSERDKGQSHAINKAFEHATGELVSWLNSDDVLLPSALREVGQYFISNPSFDIVIGGILIGGADGTVWSCHLPTASPPWCMKRGSLDLFQPSIFIRTAVLRRFGFLREDLHCLMDEELLTRLARRNLHWAYIAKPLSFLRRHPACKGETWLSRYAEERRMLLASEPHYTASQLALVRWYRRIARTLNGTRIRDLRATRQWRGRNIGEIWGWSR